MFQQGIIALILLVSVFLGGANAGVLRGSFTNNTGWMGGKAQVNTGDVQYGGGYEFVNEALNAQSWSYCDNSGSPPADELDVNTGLPIPGTPTMTTHNGVCSIFYGPNPNDGGYIRVVKATGKCTLQIPGTILTTATQPSPITITSISGSTSTTTINFSSSHMFTAGMEVIPASVTGTIAAALNGNVFVVTSIGSTSITITTAGLNGQSGSGGNVTYGRNDIGVATGGRYIVQYPNPPPTESNQGVIRNTLNMPSIDATTPCTKIAVMRLDFEALYDADNLAFNPDHLNKLATAKLGITRNLNVVHGNYSNEITWSQRKPQSYWSFASHRAWPSIYQAVATGSGLDYTASSGSGTPADKQQITTTFPSISLTCSVGASAELTFAATPPGVNDAFQIYYTFGSGTLPVNSVTSQPIVVYNTQYYVKSVVGNKITFSQTLNGADLVFSSCGTATLQAHIVAANTPASFTIGTTTVTWNNHPPLSIGDPVACGRNGGGDDLPDNYDEYQLSYYVASVPTGNTVTLAATSGGAAVTWTGTTSGNLTCVRQPTFKLSGGSAYPLRDQGFNKISLGGNSNPLAKCDSAKFCQGTLTFDAGIGAWALVGANDATGNMTLAANWPPEVYLKYAIATRLHPWVVSPQYTVDPISDYMPSLIKMYKDGKPSWMIPSFEGINECWNLFFGPTGYALNKSKANWTASLVNTSSVNGECGKIASTLGQVAQQIFGGAVGAGYDMVQGLQTATMGGYISGASQNDDRMTASLYTAQTPGTQQANLTGSWGTITFSLAPASDYVTVVATANYIQPAVYRTAQETTWGGNVRIFNATVTSNVMNVSSMVTGARPLAAGDWLYGGFLNQNQTIVAQLTGTGGASCPSVTCDGTTGTYSFTPGIGSLQSQSQQMAAIDQATTTLYANTFGGLNAICTIAGTTLTVAGIDYAVITGGFIAGGGINSATYITSFGTGTGGNGTYNITPSQTVGPVACTINPFATVPAVRSVSASTFTFTQKFTNLAGNKPKCRGYEGGYSPDYGLGASTQVDRLRAFGKLSPSMYTQSLTNQQDYLAVGCEFPSQFNLTGPQPSTLAWSVLEDLYQLPTTPLWQALKDFSSSP